MTLTEFKLIVNWLQNGQIFKFVKMDLEFSVSLEGPATNRRDFTPNL